MSFRIDYHKRHLFTITSEFYTTLDRKLISINSQKMSTLKRIIIKDFEWILLREIFILELLTIELFRRMENYSRTFPKKELHQRFYTGSSQKISHSREKQLSNFYYRVGSKIAALNIFQKISRKIYLRKKIFPPEWSFVTRTYYPRLIIS